MQRVIACCTKMQGERVIGFYVKKKRGMQFAHKHIGRDSKSNKEETYSRVQKLS